MSAFGSCVVRNIFAAQAKFSWFLCSKYTRNDIDYGWCTALSRLLAIIVRHNFFMFAAVHTGSSTWAWASIVSPLRWTKWRWSLTTQRDLHFNLTNFCFGKTIHEVVADGLHANRQSCVRAVSAKRETEGEREGSWRRNVSDGKRKNWMFDVNTTCDPLSTYSECREFSNSFECVTDFFSTSSSSTFFSPQIRMNEVGLIESITTANACCSQ